LRSQLFPVGRGLGRYRLLERALRPLWTRLRIATLWHLWCAAGLRRPKQASAQSEADDWPHQRLAVQRRKWVRVQAGVARGEAFLR